MEQRGKWSPPHPSLGASWPFGLNLAPLALLEEEDERLMDAEPERLLANRDIVFEDLVIENFERASARAESSSVSSDGCQSSLRMPIFGHNARCFLEQP